MSTEQASVVWHRNKEKILCVCVYRNEKQMMRSAFGRMGCAPSSDLGAAGETPDTVDDPFPAPPSIKSQQFYSRVVFLDVDGVLHTGHDMSVGNLFREDCMENLREIVNGPLASVGIVLSSTWRSTQRQIDDVNAQLERHSISELVGATALYGFKSRSDEILAWLEAHPHVTAFVALDDMDLSRPHGDRFAQHFVHVDVNVALTKVDAERALTILRRRLDHNSLPRALTCDPHQPALS